MHLEDLRTISLILKKKRENVQQYIKVSNVLTYSPQECGGPSLQEAPDSAQASPVARLHVLFLGSGSCWACGSR